MSFTSPVFVLFLPIVFLLHFLSARKSWQNGVLLVASYVFYGWWDYRFCFLILASSLIDYATGLWIERASDPRKRKLLLTLSLASSLIILGFFKYYHFFADSLALLLAVVGWDVSLSTLNIILPVGISFYTFQTMSYTLDIYFRRFRACPNLLDYLTFVAFFPQLVAGPIMRAHELLPQFRVARRFSAAEGCEGCRFMLWGLVKKMVLADNLGVIVSQAYRQPADVSGAELALATVAFAFQIYCDFSAYSDLAVGVAKLFNIQLKRNFAYPYFAQSLSEFWRRWHISLSTWFRDYVFIPLGGSRCSRALTARNLLATACLSGLWHGAAWHFVLWGILHGLYLVVGRWFTPDTPHRSFPAVAGGDRAWPDLRTVGRMGATFFLVCVAWVPFRASTMTDVWTIYARVFGQLPTAAFASALWALVGRYHVILLGLAVFIAFEWSRRRNWNTLTVARVPLGLRWASYTLLFWVMLCWGTTRTADFIYFRF